jgi:hypothetical protein
MSFTLNETKKKPMSYIKGVKDWILNIPQRGLSSSS